MSKHTPGPWMYDSYAGEDPYDDPDCPFVEIGTTRWVPNKVDVPAAIEAGANACLMAAAPDMLEMLEEIALEIRRGQDISEWYSGIVDTIAKAKGETE